MLRVDKLLKSCLACGYDNVNNNDNHNDKDNDNDNDNDNEHVYTTALNKNIIPHMWKLASIIPIRKPNKDTNMGTSYRPISLL